MDLILSSHEISDLYALKDFDTINELPSICNRIISTGGKIQIVLSLSDQKQKLLCEFTTYNEVDHFEVKIQELLKQFKFEK